MFEAFRASGQEPKAPKDEEAPADRGETESVGEVPVLAPAEVERPRRAAPSWHQGVVESDDVHVFPLGQRANVVFALSYNALIWVIIVFVVFAMLMCFVGYSFGSRSTTVAERPEAEGVKGGVGKKDGAEEREKDGKKGSITEKATYRVRVLSVQNNKARQRALNEDVEFLRQKGVNDLVIQPTRRATRLVLYAGAFASDQREAAALLEQRLKKMRFRGQYEFRDATVVKVTR